MNSTESYFNGYNVPECLKKRAIAIMRRFNIWGLCDGMYIANVIAHWTSLGDGESHFENITEFNPKEEDLAKAARELANAYGCNIMTDEISTLKQILVSGKLDISETIFGLTRAKARIRAEKRTCDEWRVGYLKGCLSNIEHTLEDISKGVLQYE